MGRSRSRLGLRLRLGSAGDSNSARDAQFAGQGGERRGGDGEGHNSGTSLDLSGLIQFRWELTLGEQTLSREEFERLADLGSPLVRIGEEPFLARKAMMLSRNWSHGHRRDLTGTGQTAWLRVTMGPLCRSRHCQPD